MPGLVTHMDPYTLQAKSLLLPPKSGEVLHHTHLSDRNSSIHPSNVKAFKRLLHNNNLLWPITVAINAVTKMNILEWLSLRSLPVSTGAVLCVGPGDYLRLGQSTQTGFFVSSVCGWCKLPFDFDVTPPGVKWFKLVLKFAKRVKFYILGYLTTWTQMIFDLNICM